MVYLTRINPVSFVLQISNLCMFLVFAAQIVPGISWLSLIITSPRVHFSSLIRTALWVCPTDDKFEPIAGHRLSPVPLWCTSSDLVSHLEWEFLNILASPDSKATKGDWKDNKYCTCIRILFSHLVRPAIFQQAVITWRLIQHWNFVSGYVSLISSIYLLLNVSLRLAYLSGSIKSIQMRLSRSQLNWTNKSWNG